MKQFSYVLTKPVAPHARPVSGLMREIARFDSCVSVRRDELQAEIRKPRDVLELNLRCGDEITVTIEGRDEEAALAAIQSCVVAEF